MTKLADILQLGNAGRKNSVGPHGFRRYFLRLEALTSTAPIDEYNSTLHKSTKKCSMDIKMTYWGTKTVQGITRLAPDSKGYLSGLKADMRLSSVAIQYGMHPLMVSCWACLIGKVVSDYGETAGFENRQYDNPQAQAALKGHFE